MQFLSMQWDAALNCWFISGLANCTVFGLDGPKVLAFAACLITALIVVGIGARKVAVAKRRKKQIEFEGSALW